MAAEPLADDVVRGAAPGADLSKELDRGLETGARRHISVR
jgi:hypothetical protein